MWGDNLAYIIKGKEASDNLKSEIKKDIADMSTKGYQPKLVIVRVGEKPDDISYEKSLIKNCDNLGIDCEVIQVADTVQTEEVVDIIKKLNDDKKVSGVLVFRPMPKHIDLDTISNTLSPVKDVDCMTPLNLEKIFEGDFSGYSPGTPQAAMEMLNHAGVELEGKHAVIINRTMVLGKPLAMMMLAKNATVTICHSKTANLKELTKQADIVVSALGKSKMITKDYLSEKSICVDVGVSLDSEGKLSGDLDYENLVDYVSMITPTPGGTGAVTTTILLSNVVKAAKIING